MRDTAYYVYSTHATIEAAEAALDGYFNRDEICAAEQPHIKSERRVVRDQTALYRTVYCVMFPCS